MPIKVTDSKGEVIYQISTGTGTSTGKVTSVQKGSSTTSTGPISEQQLESILKGVSLDDQGQTWQLDKLFQTLGVVQLDPASGKVDVTESLKRLQVLSDSIAALEQSLGAEKATTPQDTVKISLIEIALKTAKAQLVNLHGQLKGQTLAAPQEQQLKSIVASSPDLQNAQTPGGGKAQVGNPTPQPGAQPSAPPAQPYPGAGKAQGFPGAGMPMDINQLLQSSMFQTMNLNSMDALGKTQMDQKKMMMLFMYFAMMAMSGDIGAMTAFMQFITVIITKDKSQQNINMANKLIELEDASRAATDELLNTPSFDPNNSQVGSDFMKTMEKVKAEQGSIATSQKLIAQMMEEFAQVSEFLNNLQKSLLDVRGRIMSRVSNLNS